MFRYRTSDITKSDLEALKKEGIEVLVFDIDGTLISLFDVVFNMPFSVSNLIKSAKKLNLKIFIISNTTDLGKIKAASEDLRINEDNIISRGNGDRWKPWRMEKALKKLKVSPKKTIMIGNNLFTDGIGAKCAKMKFCWVFRP